MNYTGPDHTVYWATVVPANIANLTGYANYSTTNICGTAGTCIGSDNNGLDLTSVDMSFGVDFSTGAINSGQLNVEDAAMQNWIVNFDGTVIGAIATMNNISGSVFDSSGSFQSGIYNAEIGGVFTGTTGTDSGFVSGFAMQSGGAFIQGMTTLQENINISE